jgi:L-Ala-D/L-Glu epimerase
MKLILHQFDLKLKHTFKIAHDARDVQKTLIVELKDGELSGFGEATASVYYKHSIESMSAVLEANRAVIEAYDYQEPSAFWERVHGLFEGNSFALCGLDVAVNDLFAKKKGVSCMQLWGTDNGIYPATNYTIGIDTIENMAAKLKEFPWPSYKIKLGTNEDVAIVQALRKLTDANFRIDANCGWTADETIANSIVMKELGVEFLEQPLKADDWEGMKKVKAESVLPVIADESIKGESDVVRCAEVFHGINIKLMKCGGLTPARRMINTAKSLGLKVMVGCMTESSVGISAVAQLLPELDYVDMDGFLLIANDTAVGPVLNGQTIEISKSPGIGIPFLQPS